MELKEGGQAGPYKILSLLGAGGMGAVYRARDTKLGRDVAIKVIPSEVALVPERLARFRREAQVLASLNHPHIAAIHGLEEIDGRPFLVLELVEGEDLSARVARGALTIEEAIVIARQVAEAIESAHEKGIIHRDLKPGNIKVTEDGTVKVLDFGLAKVLAADGGNESSELSQSPTFSRQATAVGVILGTAAYMSPEQAKGKSVDKRCDIWAFGCVLFEMLTGKKAFSGETVSETFAEILKGEPDWNRLPNDVPRAVRNLLKRCLTKDPKHRLRDIGDAWEALNETGAPGDSLAPRGGKKFLVGVVLATAVVASILTALVMRYLNGQAPESGPTRRFTIRLEKQPDLDWNLALSPDGARLAYVARVEGTRRLVLRHLGEEADHVLPGTEDAGWVFFSPDGEWIGFLTVSATQASRNPLGALKKVPLGGGAPITIQEGVFVGAATWGDDDSIIFQSGSEARLERVSSQGGTAQPLNLAPEGEKGDFWSPRTVLPNGEALLATNGAGQVAAFSLTGGKSTMVVDSGAISAAYVPSGHVVYFKQGKLLAVPFDGKRLVVSGAPVPVAEGMGPYRWAFSWEGTLVYGLVPKSRLVWVSRSGVEETLPIPAGHIWLPRVAPDGSRITLGYNTFMVENPDIWLYDLARATMSRLTLDPTREYVSLWSPDGQKVFFVSFKGAFLESDNEIRSISADGTGGIEHWLTSPRDRWPFSWSRDGEGLIFEENNTDTGSDIGMLGMDGKGTVTPVIREAFDQSNPAVSPDGRLLAYESNESGRLEVYVQRFSELGPLEMKRQISNQGGTGALWGRDSRELFYREGEAMMAVSIEAVSVLKLGVPRVLFRGDYVHSIGRDYDYDRRNDRFLMLKNDQSESESRELHFVLNCVDELKRLAPPN